MQHITYSESRCHGEYISPQVYVIYIMLGMVTRKRRRQKLKADNRFEEREKQKKITGEEKSIVREKAMPQSEPEFSGKE